MAGKIALGSLAIAAAGAALLVFGGPASAQTTISFWYAGSAGQDKYFNGATKRYEAKNPGVKIRSTVLPSPARDIEAKLNAAKLSGTFPDVFAAYLIFIGTRGAQGDFASMEKYFGRWSEKDDLLKSTVEMGRFKGRLVGLGYAPAPLMQLYRKDYFREAGLDPNKPPTTWEELHAYARKLVRRDAAGNVIRTGFDIPTMDSSNTFLEPFLRGNGSPFIDEINFAPT
jgi:ABC-type glycerol-3-phosphate transport system substrate-binding protein